MLPAEDATRGCSWPEGEGPEESLRAGEEVGILAACNRCLLSIAPLVPWEADTKESWPRFLGF